MPDNGSIVRHNLLDTQFYEELLSESILLKELDAAILQLSTDCHFLLSDLYYLLYKKILVIGQPIPLTLHGMIIDAFSKESGLNKLRTRTAGNRSETHVALWVLTRDLLERLRGAAWVRESTELLAILQDSDQSLDSGPPTEQQPDNPNLIQDFWKDLLTKKSQDAISFITSALKPDNDLAEQVDTLEEMADQLAQSEAQKESKNGPLTPNNFEKARKTAGESENPLESFLETAADEIKKEQEESSTAPASESTSDSLPLQDPLKPPSAPSSASSESNNLGDALKKVSSEARRRLTGISPGTWRGKDNSFLIPAQEGPDIRRVLSQSAPDRTKTPLAAGLEADQTLRHTSNASPLKSPAGITPMEHSPSYRATEKEIILKKISRNMVNINAATLFDHSSNQLDKLRELMSHVGTAPQEMDTLSFDEAIGLYKRTQDPQMIRFFNKVGQKREIAKLAQHRKKSRRDIPVDRIRPDDDLDSIIDDEFTDLAIGIDAFENSFIDRFLHKSLLTRARVTRTAKHKGPIVLCYDGSGSMEGEKIFETKAHILAFIEVARRQKRRMITIQFASAAEPLFVREIQPRNIHFPEILELMDTFLRGGTDFERPLKEALKYLETDRFRNGDILFITDGICDISNSFKQRFLASKADKKFHLYAVIIHGNTYQDYGDLSDIADEVLEIRQRDMSDWNQGVSEKMFSI